MRRIILMIGLVMAIFPLLAQNAGQISQKRLELIKKFHNEFEQKIALQNAISNNSINALAKNRTNVGKTDHEFKYKVSVKGITNQKSSGRCWMFTGLNVLRPAVISKYNLTGFEFSTNYLYFFDILEKSNLFINEVQKTALEPMDNKKVEWLLKSPIGDGGVWNSFTNLVDKYGFVPKEAMPETYHSEKTGTLNKMIRTKLRENALVIREMIAAGKTGSEVESTSTQMLAEIYHLLALHLGTPPEEFTWRFRNSNGELSEEKTYTPQEFKKELFPELDFNEHVMLMDDPTREYYKLYEIDLDRNVLEGKNWRYINLPAKEIKQYALASIKNNNAMYFSCDVGKQLDKKEGLLSLDNYDYEALYGVKFGMNKDERVRTFASGSSHGMALVGVDVDENEHPTKWLLENSWGASSGHQGYLTMTDKWFDEYMFRVVVKKEYVTPKVLKILKMEPVVLPPWDPMFAPDN